MIGLKNGKILIYDIESGKPIHIFSSILNNLNFF